jgi:hypothetical protein
MSAAVIEDRDEFGVIGVHYVGSHPKIAIAPIRWFTTLQFGAVGISVFHIDGRFRQPPRYQRILRWEKISQILVREPSQKVRIPGSTLPTAIGRAFGLPGRQGAFEFIVEEEVGTATFINDQIGPSALATMLSRLWREHPSTRPLFCFPDLGDIPGATQPDDARTLEPQSTTMADELDAVDKALSVLSDTDDRRERLLAKRDRLIDEILDDNS